MHEDEGQAWRTAAKELLPCWFADRMLADPGRFAFLLDTRQILIVDSIHAVRQAPGGIVWLDLEIVVPHRKDGFPWGFFPVLKASGRERALCSLNAAHIVAVVEVDPWELPPLEPEPG